MAQELSFRDIQVSSDQVVVRKIGLGDLWTSLREGYDDFNAKPSYGLFLILIYPVFALLITLFLLGENLLYLVFPMVAGFTLLGPVVSVVLFEMSRRRERGLELSWFSAFDFVHTSSFAPIVALSMIMMLLYVAWLSMAQFMYFGLFGVDPPVSVADFVNQLLTTQRGAALILYGNFVGFLFAFTVLAISVVGFPLLLDRPATAFTAIGVSIRAVATNVWVMAVWGVIVVLLLAVGASLLLMGLPAILPILGHATWHLYRKMVEP
jgi:uncharacterized membrane protein